MQTGRDVSQMVSRAQDALERNHNSQEMLVDKESLKRDLEERAESWIQDYLDDEGIEVEFSVEVDIV